MHPNRIVCLAAEIPELLYRLGALDRVVGISAYTKGPAEALHIPKISGFKHGNIHHIKQTNPDLAILTSNVQKELAAQLIEEGIPVLHLSPHRLEDLFLSIFLIGNLVGKWKEAEELSNELRQEIDRVKSNAAQLAWHPRVYFEEWMDPLICGIGWVSDIIEIAGGHDVFRQKSITGRKADMRMIQPEEVAAAAPDIIFASWCGKPFEFQSMISRPSFAKLQAVSRNAVYELDSQILQFGPMIIESLKEVHRIIKDHVSRHPYQMETGEI